MGSLGKPLPRDADKRGKHSSVAKGIAVVDDKREMNGATHSSRRHWILGCTVTGVTLLQGGCIGLAANLINVVKGHTVKAEYDGLEGARVAVVTLTDGSQYSDDTSARVLSRRVSDILQEKVKKIELVREDEVQQWRDEKGWDAIEFLDIGRGVKAEKVVAIEMTNLRLRDGATLYRGRATVTISVYNIGTGRREFSRHLDEFTYPETAGQYASETTDSRFRGLYLGVLATRLARYFHSYDYSDTVALDATIIHQ